MCQCFSGMFHVFYVVLRCLHKHCCIDGYGMDGVVRLIYAIWPRSAPVSKCRVLPSVRQCCNLTHPWRNDFDLQPKFRRFTRHRRAGPRAKFSSCLWISSYWPQWGICTAYMSYGMAVFESTWKSKCLSNIKIIMLLYAKCGRNG